MFLLSTKNICNFKQGLTWNFKHEPIANSVHHLLLEQEVPGDEVVHVNWQRAVVVDDEARS